jgi:PilZ domain
MSSQYEEKRSSAEKVNAQMKPRYRRRIQIKIPVMFTSGSQVGKGQILDLTIPGCLIESTVGVQATQSLQLEMSLPGYKFPVSVTLGVVRWKKGKHFGVEFIKMHESQQLILKRFMAQRGSDPLATKAGGLS